MANVNAVQIGVFQSTRPHEGRDGEKALTRGIKEVSIHAPPRGARPRLGRERGSGMTVSIHAPPRGARRSLSRTARSTPGFNPRAPTRGATIGGGQFGHDVTVSIHAPPRGARPTGTSGATIPLLFQSTRPHEGRDPAARGARPDSGGFNPRAPTRGATMDSPSRHRLSTFQSTRPHEGRDQSAMEGAIYAEVSIHAPPRGARPHTMQLVTGVLRFQSTRPHEGRDQQARGHNRR